MYQKQPRFESKRYRDFVTSLECFCCNKPGPSECHHIKGVGGYSGAGMKASDYLSMPLCSACHHKLHICKLPLDMQFVWIAETIDRAFRAGIIGLTKDIF